MLQHPMHPLQVQLVQQQPTPHPINIPPQQMPLSPFEIQPPPSACKQPIHFHQAPEMIPSGSSASSSSSGGSNSNPQTPHLKNVGTNAISDNEEDKKIRDKCLYLKQLLQDKKQIQNFNGCFIHVDRILDEEIVKVRSVLFQNGDKQPLELPSPRGPTITLTEKLFVPVKEHPEYNFVGRLLGPRGLTAKQLEQETKCKIMVRGKGSMRDKKKEDANRGKQNWEHLSEDLHVLISVEDTENRAHVKMQRALEEIKKLLIPTEGEDELKKKQLMELAIINGTYRDYSENGQPRILSPPHVFSGTPMRPPVSGQPSLGVFGTPIISRLPNGQTVIGNEVCPPPPVIASSDGTLLYYAPVDYPHSALSLQEYNLVDPTTYISKGHLQI